MSTPATGASEPSPHDAALERLKSAPNPFDFTVVTAGTEDECSRFDVPEFLDPQLADLRHIIAQYRDGRPPSRVYPILGAVGTGKTHLLTRLTTELNREAVESGAESILINIGHIPTHLNGIDYLYRLLVSHLLETVGPGRRTTTTVAARLTARLLAEALRQLPHHKQIALIPLEGAWANLKLRFGSSRVSQAQLDKVTTVIQACDAKRPTEDDLRKAVEDAGIPFEKAVELIDEYLERTEPKDAQGTMRRVLYSRLSKLALLGDREPFEDLHLGNAEDLPAYLKAPSVSETATKGSENGPRVFDRWLLTAWLELIDELQIPLILVFDQIEDAVLRPTEADSATAVRAFTQFLSGIISNVPDVCVFVFAEEREWLGGIVQNANQFIKERIHQPFDLPGRPSRLCIAMPDRIPADVLTRLIRKRIQTVVPDLDFTGLPSTFPFSDADISRSRDHTSIRQTLRVLNDVYKRLVYPPEVDVGSLRLKLENEWKLAVARAKKELGTDGVFSAAKIPEVQATLDGWLQLLAREGLMGSASWHGVEMLHVEHRGQYGYLNVVRTEGPNAPGLGIAAWLAGSRTKAIDLQRRLEFFDDNPCPIRTLVALCQDGPDGVTATSRLHYDKAIKSGLDVRVVKFEPKHIHALFALDKWRQAIAPDLDQSREEGATVYREVLHKVSEQLLNWIDEWRSPRKVLP